jgi:hypothetical protein
LYKIPGTKTSFELFKNIHTEINLETLHATVVNVQ